MLTQQLWEHTLPRICSHTYINPYVRMCMHTDGQKGQQTVSHEWMPNYITHSPSGFFGNDEFVGINNFT